MRYYNALVVTVPGDAGATKLERIGQSIGNALRGGDLGEFDGVRLGSDADEIRFHVWRPVKARFIVEMELERRGLIPGALVDLRHDPGIETEDDPPEGGGSFTPPLPATA